MYINILFFGDIIGRCGRHLLRDNLSRFRSEYRPDLIIANGENASSGFGITKKSYDELIGFGIDVITTGNHVWDRKDLENDIDKCPNMLRPYNFPKCQPGIGYLTLDIKGVKVSILNLIGRVFMGGSIDCPFNAFDNFIDAVGMDGITIVDFHGEATSEKVAFGMYVDGFAGAILGTHTHVQTNDDRILPKGSFYITDVGMCGSLDSVIGMKSEKAIRKFITGIPEKHEVEMKGRAVFSGVFLQFDVESKKVSSFNKIYNVFGD